MIPARQKIRIKRRVMYRLDFHGYFLSETAIPEETGIYLVYSCSVNKESRTVSLKELLYIGQSVKTSFTSLQTRVRQHIDKGDFTGYCSSGETLCYSYAICDGRSIDAIENGLIYMQEPPANKTLKDNYHFSTPASFVCTGQCGLMEKKSFTIADNIIGGGTFVL